MQIGKFARICGTKISVLRHYDKEGLLPPDYVDAFTGYRYYSKEQIAVFNRITALKKGGFSLPEIRDILKQGKSCNELAVMFEKKRNELKEMLINLEEVKEMVLGALSNDTTKTETGGASLHENIDLPFENDETVVGKWEIVGEFDSKEDFFDGGSEKDTEAPASNIYFLPGGAQYWVYSWTKNKLLITTGDGSYVNEFTTEQHDGENYMFVSFKSYYYRQSGKPTVLVLRQLDNRAYSADELARKDDINRRFIADDRIIGGWKAVDFCRRKQDFDPERIKGRSLFFDFVEFLPGGEVISRYDFGKSVIRGRDMQEWTKGFVLRKWNSTACAYELCTVNGTEYLFIEWKSGDYIYGGFDSDYYVFVRE